MSIEDNDKSLDRYAYVVEGGHHCDDLHSHTQNDNSSLANARENAMQRMENWLAGKDDDNYCVHGKRILNSCICDDSHSGERCDEEAHTQRNFRIVTIASVVIPTILLLIIGGIVWVCGKKEDSDFGARPALYT